MTEHLFMFHLELPSAGDPWTTRPVEAVWPTDAHTVQYSRQLLELCMILYGVCSCLLSGCGKRTPAVHHQLHTALVLGVYATRCHVQNQCQGLFLLTALSLHCL